MLSGLIHNFNTASKRIRNLCREYGVAEPRIEVSENWFTVIFPRPAATQETTGKPESQPESLTTRILELLKDGPLSKSDISARLGQKKVSGQLNKVIRILLTDELIAFTIPEKPKSRLQKYQLTQTGKRILQKRRSKSP